MSKNEYPPFPPARAPKIPSKATTVHHHHYGAGAIPAGGGMGIQPGYSGDPLHPTDTVVSGGGSGLYTAFRGNKPVLAVFIAGRLGNVCRTGSLNVLEVDRAQALELAMQLIAYAQLPEGTHQVSGLSGGGGGGSGASNYGK